MSEITCRILRGDEEIYSSDKRGIAPLIELTESGMDTKGCVAYDKIVGKAAAFLYVLMEIGEVRAEVLSTGGAKVFEQYGIPFSYKTLAEKIINRTGDGICPMEKTVLDIYEPEKALIALKKTVEALSKHKK